jgi:hypothetical protein
MVSRELQSADCTDQEIAFARLVLSGTMTDRQAAEAGGLNPDSAAYTKSKPHVRAYMLEHRAAVQQQLVQQEADLSCLPRPAVGLARRQATTIDPQRSPAPDPQETQQEDSPAVPAPGSAGAGTPDPGPTHSTFANRFTPSEAPPSPYVPLFASVPDLGVGFPLKNPFVRAR